MKLGEALTEAKDEKQITRKDLSEKVQIDVLTIKAIEHSDTGHLPKIKTLFEFFGYKMSLVLKKKGKKEIKIKI